MSGVNKDYNFDSKNLWRKQTWNNILKLVELKKRARNAVVLYLAGKENLDLPIASSKGFRFQNMIAVDKYQDVVKYLRHQGQNTINANFSDVLFNWGDSLGIDVIHADFCSGINGDALKFIDAVLGCKGIHYGTVISLNFLRGRDAQFNDERLALSNMLLNDLHRGELWFHAFWSRLMRPVLDDWERSARHMLKYHHAALNTYKSGNLTFDSIVFTVRLFQGEVEFKKNNRIASKIAAAKAIRTMRL